MKTTLILLSMLVGAALARNRPVHSVETLHKIPNTLDEKEKDPSPPETPEDVDSPCKEILARLQSTHKEGVVAFSAQLAEDKAVNDGAIIDFNEVRII